MAAQVEAKEESKLFSTVAMCGGLTALVLLRNDVAQLPTWWASLVVSLVFLHCLVVLYRRDHGRRVTLGFMFAAMFGLFHFGLYLAVVFGVDFAIVSATEISWVYAGGFERAGLYAAIGLYAFASAYTVVRGSGPGWMLRPAKRPALLRANLYEANGTMGGVVTILGVGLWVRNLIVGGVQLGDNYVVYLSKTADLSMPVALLLVGFGVSLLGAGSGGALAKAGLVCALVWAPFAALLGLRGEVLFPAVAFFISRSRRTHVPFGARRLTVITLAALSIGSILRVARLGTTNLNQLLAASNPAASLVELGYSIRPMMLSLQWRLSDMEPFVGVATYLAPFRRFIVGRILGGEVLPVAADPAVLGGVMSTRVGPVGGSLAAEAYRVGGLAAIMVVLALIGAAVAVADTAAIGDPVADATVALGAFVVLLWIRNDFTPVPFECLLAVLVILVIRALGGLSPWRRRGAQGRDLIAAEQIGPEVDRIPPAGSSAGTKVKKGDARYARSHASQQAGR